MNRPQLIAEILEHLDTADPEAGWTKKDVAAALEGFQTVVTTQVASGEPVNLSGFCKFVRVERPARDGRNPATGEPIKIKASKRVRITPLKAFKDVVLAGKSKKK